jgi:deoxyribodipyrimidine photolyase
LLTKNDEPFRAYSAFARAWRKAPKPAPVRIVKALRAAVADVNPADFMRPATNPLAKGYPLPMVDHDRERENRND